MQGVMGSSPITSTLRTQVFTGFFTSADVDHPRDHWLDSNLTAIRVRNRFPDKSITGRCAAKTTVILDDVPEAFYGK